MAVDDNRREEARRASIVMCQLINAQAKFWMKVGMLAKANPTMAVNDIVKAQFSKVNGSVDQAIAA